eukprot:gnl/MRDRNA2_/MRDRNA2_50042_c0_seq2.p1 gnl/MRDRNA2_/MRDRNA2_50042_c0~~gnl/MRDRNA2_/MRDRNA2_50042_c0_seq2.p1  ORF type:complete len:203 (+),score=28.06 gnl/MRDRNA2_/MRDRNA2_50042_c0_seq2:171-779(+)
MSKESRGHAGSNGIDNINEVSFSQISQDKRTPETSASVYASRRSRVECSIGQGTHRQHTQTAKLYDLDDHITEGDNSEEPKSKSTSSTGNNSEEPKSKSRSSTGDGDSCEVLAMWGKPHAAEVSQNQGVYSMLGAMMLTAEHVREGHESSSSFDLDEDLMLALSLNSLPAVELDAPTADGITPTYVGRTDVRGSTSIPSSLS